MSSENSAEIMTADIDLAVGSRRLRTRISMPVVPTSPSALLPITRALSDAAVASVCEDAAALNKPISCTAGCGACCRQLVPITEVEARRLLEVVEAMPEPHRSEIRERFARARQRLVEAGMLDWLLERSNWQEGQTLPRAMEYFHLGIACPFLEDESCSIYAERPLVCRDYLVISPAKNCRNPGPDTVRTLKMPFETWRALARTAAEHPDDAVAWVPLILALEWAEANPEPAPTRNGTELVKDLFERLTGRKVPPPPATPSKQGSHG